MVYLPIQKLEFIPRFCFHYQNFNKKTNFPNSRMTEFYEIDLITEGAALLTIDKVAYFFEPGDICFRKPGQWNKYSWNHKYECDTLHFEIKAHSVDAFDTIFNTFPTFLHAKNYEETHRIFQSLKESFSSSAEYDQLNTKIKTMQLIKQLYITVGKNEDSKTLCHPAIRKIIPFIHENISENLTTQIIAEKCGLSPSYFQMAFKSSTGKTPNQFITEQRLNLARKKLLSTKLSIGDIAFDCGFSSSSYFIYVFKNMYHQTPTQFRQAFDNTENP